MEERILELSKSYSVILVPGPRQAGKTTMPRSLAEKENIGCEYVTLDNSSPRNPFSIRKRLQLILERAGCKKVRFHDLRHTFATMALEHGMDVKNAFMTIGHVSSATTANIYSHIDSESKKLSAAAIGQALT